MQKAIDALKKSFGGIRTGRAHPALIEKLEVDYYGSNVPLQQLASISVPESRQLLVTPFDKSAVKAIEKAIMTSDLGITPLTGTDTIRITMPPLTEERRKDLMKVVKQYTEDAKVSIRNARHETIDRLKKQEKAKEITEDEEKNLQNEVQQLTDRYNQEIDKLFKQKEIDILQPQ
jgi:ribosome recycling factor